MSETYLNGKISLSSLAAPSARDLEKVRNLSERERETLIDEVLETGRNSPVSDATPDDIWNTAVKKAKALKDNSEYVL